MKLKMLLILSVLGFSAESYSSEVTKDIIKYSKCLALGATASYFQNESRLNPSSNLVYLLYVASLICNVSNVLGKDNDNADKKLIVTLLGAFIFRKITVLKI